MMVPDKQQIKEKDDDVIMMMIIEIVLLLSEEKRRTVEVYLVSYSKVFSSPLFFLAYLHFSLGIG